MRKLFGEEVKEVGFTQESWTAALRAGKKLNKKWDVFARYAFQLVELSEVEISPEELEKERLVDGRMGNLGIGLVRHTWDNPFLPTRGTYMSFGVRMFARVLASEFTFVKGRFTVSHVKSLKGGSSLATGVRIGLAFPYGSDEAVPISEAFFAGGDSTIRGFTRDAVGPASGGEGLLIFNGELRFPIWRDLKGVIFYDAGNVYPQVSDFDPSDLRHVLGTGLRLETAIGPIRLEYGRKVDREPGESSGEFFLSIGSAF